MKILFLNTWHATLADELQTYIQNNLSSTSIFCFQEADSTSRALYENLLLPDFELFETKRLEVDGTWYTNATYVRRTLKVVERYDLFLEQPEGMHLGVANYVTVEQDGKRITVCNVHGIPQPGNKLDSPARLYQTETLINTFAEHESVVIGGDFNLLPEAQSVRSFAEHGYRNLIVDYNVQTTRNAYTFDKYPNNIQYYADYVFVSPILTVTSFVVPEVIVSDHQPLEVIVQ